MRVFKLHLNLLIAILLELCPHSAGFSILTTSITSYSYCPVKKIHTRSSSICNNADPVATQDAEITVEDKNGNFISVGSIVRVAVDNVKAHQVPAKGYGRFNDKKEFISAATDDVRATKCLLVPAGFRGIVTKVYNVKSSLSANFPVQVKFSPGEYTDEGYSSPVPFLMHFGLREVESV